MRKNKLLTVAIVIIAISALIITAAAATLKFTSASKSFKQLYVNRVCIEVDATEFKFKKNNNDDKLHCVLNLKMSKGEEDFYGLLHSATLSGGEFGFVTYVPHKNNDAADKLPQNVTLKTEPNEWEIGFTIIPEEGKTHYDISLDINYTTGLKPNNTQRYMTSIPITIDIE